MAGSSYKQWAPEDAYWFKLWIAALKNCDVENLLQIIDVVGSAKFGKMPETEAKQTLLHQIAGPHGKTIAKALLIKVGKKCPIE